MMDFFKLSILFNVPHFVEMNAREKVQRYDGKEGLGGSIKVIVYFCIFMQLSVSHKHTNKYLMIFAIYGLSGKV